jgi:hypothetical protein
MLEAPLTVFVMFFISKKRRIFNISMGFANPEAGYKGQRYPRMEKRVTIRIL